MTALLEMSAVAAGYDGAPVLRRIDLSLPPGSVTAVLGPNGAGKTTLTRVLIGEVKARAGMIRFDGRDITRAGVEARARAGVALVPEGRRVFPGLTVEENLAVASRAAAGRRSRDIAAIYAMFPILAERPHVRAWQLSGGQQQMLSIGRALMAHPKLIVLDEPTLGLAPAVVADIWAQVGKMSERGTAVLIGEQNAARLAGLAARRLYLSDGVLVASDNG